MISNFLVTGFIFLIVFCLAIWFLQRQVKKNGGAAAKRKSRHAIAVENSKNIIVDTLNVTHWMYGKVSSTDIANTINKLTPLLAKIYKGDIMFVLKDQDNSFYSEEDHKLFKWLSDKNKITIYVAEKYIDPPQSQNKKTDIHSAKGRDDFYMSVLAAKYKCAVVTEDAMKDFGKFCSNIQPFHVLIYRFWKDIPDKDYIRPEFGYSNLRRPFRVHPSELWEN